jgi:hypothetical protein
MWLSLLVVAAPLLRRLPSVMDCSCHVDAIAGLAGRPTSALVLRLCDLVGPPKNCHILDVTRRCDMLWLNG